MANVAFLLIHLACGVPILRFERIDFGCETFGKSDRKVTAFLKDKKKKNATGFSLLQYVRTNENILSMIVY